MNQVLWTSILNQSVWPVLAFALVAFAATLAGNLPPKIQMAQLVFASAVLHLSATLLAAFVGNIHFISTMRLMRSSLKAVLIVIAYALFYFLVPLSPTLLVCLAVAVPVFMTWRAHRIFLGRPPVMPVNDL